MKIVNGFSVINYAQERRLLLPAFNTTNLETTIAIVQGLNDANLPGLVQISSNNLQLSSPQVIADITRYALTNSNVPIGLHLDHGKSYEDVKACVDAGFTSIMIDASHLEYEENIKEVRRCTDYCHLYGIPVEAELGAISGKEDDDVNEADCKTDPELVKDFVERSGCDLLAVSVGNVHGLEATPKIDLHLLEEIAKVSPVPLVLHGGSGIDFDVIRKMKQFNLIKVNYGSDLRKAYIQTFGKAYELNHNEANLFGLSTKATKNVRNKAKELVTIINQ
ncbi:MULTISPECIES: class II aldolase [Breznakia]|uniref:Ketose-bisphosphate aldolase n=1 Tax=Breznakia blatticola TaxID=1754012 RepID=A0A4R8A592_9FIRM|nr:MULTISPECIES: class II aldolase [Breznakia]MDH6368059.1 fructose-bisphosphate aldolase class II [Breznakia sp. PH1-1]MDH6405147.1 fructose-bisphosphate aldolase class II [Breznakia sp. PF1-11]MDH6412864.1 fructose-bisphosphate aldolase class II [Breznakia sp. PFB1-11]MDH6415223.1 fructose-bisphosphate aldolase class II [Breznakia sp. PFB1-14]MDH6417535.1 fructose-bisphosphate aldolase class II [Breznakia sp. PFB1-4]